MNARYSLNPISFPSKKKKRKQSVTSCDKCVFLRKSWQRDERDLLSANWVEVVHFNFTFNRNVVCPIETVIDSFDSATVSSIKLICVIALVLAYNPGPRSQVPSSKSQSTKS